MSKKVESTCTATLPPEDDGGDGGVERNISQLVVKRCGRKRKNAAVGDGVAWRRHTDERRLDDVHARNIKRQPCNGFANKLSYMD